MRAGRGGVNCRPLACADGDSLHPGTKLSDLIVKYAATGLAAAWLLTKWAGFRTVTVYIDKAPDADLRKRLGFREEEQGANLWLTVPNDEGVFAGAAEHDGVRCVHPVQAYLDVKQHPERAAEAAERLRRDFLSWGKSA